MDHRIRKLEKRVLANPGDVSSRVRWLRLKKRSGDVSGENIRLMAYCGDRAARKIIPHWNDCSGWSMDRGDGRACYPDVYHDDEWFLRLERWGPRILARACLAALEDFKVRCWCCGGDGFLKSEVGSCEGLCPFCEDTNSGPTIALPIDFEEFEDIVTECVDSPCPARNEELKNHETFQEVVENYNRPMVSKRLIDFASLGDESE